MILKNFSFNQKFDKEENKSFQKITILILKAKIRKNILQNFR